MDTLAESTPAVPVPGGTTESTGRGRVAGRVAAVLGIPYVLLNAYWAFGGTGLLSRYGSHVVGRAVPGDVAFRVTSAVLVVLMVVAVVAGLIATGARGEHRPLARWAALLSAGWLTLYGGAMTFIGVAVPLAAYSDSPGIDAQLYRWHALLWDPWFLVWGLVLLVALIRKQD